MKYEVVEKFISINGEGQKSGELSVFVRLRNCNLECSYCDTKWANSKDTECKLMDENEIYDYIKKTKIHNVTLTGGEPLEHENIGVLIEKITQDDLLNLEIETNGSKSIKPFLNENLSFTLDYKLPSSNMETHMLARNYDYISKKDSVKFVIQSREDLSVAKFVIEKHNLLDKTTVFFSPVFGKIESKKIVEFMIDHNLNGVKLQLQLHKYIWSPSKKGV
ncbi:MAG: putative 7-carboxy-7-deazaguanine synthase QueE [Fusobacteriota bacterium]